MKSFKWITFTYYVFCFGALLGCASKPLQYEGSKDLAKIEEFDKIVKIKDIPPEVEPTPSPPATETKADSAKKQKQKKKTFKKPKKEKIPVKAKHYPAIEDSLGFDGRRPTADPFRVGEKVVMMMTYFGVSAGDMSLEVRPFKEVNEKKAYHFYVSLKSSTVFSLFYLVDDYGESYVDYDTLLPISMSIDAKESKKLLAVKEVFDHTKNEGKRWERLVNKDEEPKEKKTEWEILPYAQNVLSAFYYIRTFQLIPGKQLKFHVGDDGKNMVVKVDVLRKEKIKTLLGEFDTVVIKPTVEIGGIFQPMGDVFFWITDDDRKLFVKLEAQIKIGKVVGVLRELER